MKPYAADLAIRRKTKIIKMPFDFYILHNYQSKDSDDPFL